MSLGETFVSVGAKIWGRTLPAPVKGNEAWKFVENPGNFLARQTAPNTR
jgi:hypothetical protein